MFTVHVAAVFMEWAWQLLMFFIEQRDMANLELLLQGGSCNWHQNIPASDLNKMFNICYLHFEHLFDLKYVYFFLHFCLGDCFRYFIVVVISFGYCNSKYFSILACKGNFLECSLVCIAFNAVNMFLSLSRTGCFC